MFLRLVADSFTRRPKRKMLTLAALALGMAVATVALSVSLDVGDRLAQEFRSLGANLLVTPQADSLPLEIGGVDYRPANAGAYLPEADLGKLKTIFWRFNIKAFAPILEVQVKANSFGGDSLVDPPPGPAYTVIGAWVNHEVKIADGTTYVTGIEKTNPWWHVKEGRWFAEGKNECVIGENLVAALGVRGRELPGSGGLVAIDKLKPGSNLFTYPLNGHLGPTLRVVGILDTGGPEDDAIIVPLDVAQSIADKPGQYRRLYVSALTKPEDAFGRKDPKSMTQAEFDRWYCSPYISAIALQISQELKGTDVRVIRRVAEGEGTILTRVRTLLWLVTFAALMAAALAVGASAAASGVERRTEIGFMKALRPGPAPVALLLLPRPFLSPFV